MTMELTTIILIFDSRNYPQKDNTENDRNSSSGYSRVVGLMYKKFLARRLILHPQLQFCYHDCDYTFIDVHSKYTLYFLYSTRAWGSFW